MRPGALNFEAVRLWSYTNTSNVLVQVHLFFPATNLAQLLAACSLPLPLTLLILALDSCISNGRLPGSLSFAFSKDFYEQGNYYGACRIEDLGSSMTLAGESVEG